jgi:hypothetical protein
MSKSPQSAAAKATGPADILAAMRAPDLFGPQFKGDTWDTWKAFLAGLFGLPMSDLEAALFRTHTGRSTLPTAAFKEAALIVGRRGGKSRVLALIAVFLACFRDYAPHLAPGEVATIAVLAANRQQARSIFRFVTGMLKATPLIASLVTDENAESIELANGVVIEISTASFRTTRGYSFAAVLCDEIAFWRQDEASANPDVEILRALRPGMANIPGSILLLASSPYAKRGALYATFRKHYGQDDAKVLVWKADTAAMNPRIDPDIISEAYESDPEAARAEYGAEFRDDLADFVTREIVDAVTAVGRTELPPESGVAYSAFCDPSGGMSDSMTLAIAHMTAPGVVVLDMVRETRAPFDPEATVADFAAVLRRYGIDRVTGDRYGGEWPRQRFREAGITYEPSARPKSDLYLGLLPLLTTGRVELLDIPRLAAQLVGLERRTARSGRDSVDHIPGGHDDIANSVAGALVGLDLDRRPSLIRADDLRNGSEAVPYPKAAEMVGATLWVADDGTAAVAYFSFASWLFASGGAPMQILDFDAAPLTGATIRGISDRLDTLRREIRCNFPASLIWLPRALVYQAHMGGVQADAFSDHLLRDIPGLALSSAGSVASGLVKICDTAMEKAKSHPLGGALNFRAGEKMDADPLRLAVLLAIEMTLGDERARSAA